MMDQEEIDDILDVANFLYWAEDTLAGAVNKQEAWEAFCRLVDIDPVKLEIVIRGED